MFVFLSVCISHRSVSFTFVDYKFIISLSNICFQCQRMIPIKIDDASIKSEDKEKGRFSENKSRKRKRTRKSKVVQAIPSIPAAPSNYQVYVELETVKEEFRELRRFVEKSFAIQKLLAQPDVPKLLIDLNAYFQEPYVPSTVKTSQRIGCEVPQGNKN